ncbi:MAG TPA: hypothetical protein VF552_03405 [Allosphingosinicella sp.]|jgi:hypothetical protein
MAFKYAAAAGRVNGSIDMPLAAVAALAVGFAAFVMPDGILNRIVEGSGLPSILSAAQPPLGTTARAGVSAAAAAATFAIVFMLLRMLDRGSGKAPTRERDRERAPLFEEAEGHTTVTPKLRRADIHPDAPARRPILATRELGEPDLRQAPPIAAEAPPLVVDVPDAAAVPDPEPEPEPEPEPVPTPEPRSAAEPEVAIPESVAVSASSAERVPVLDELELSGPDIQMMVTPPAAAPAPVEVAARAAPAADATIADLMARLEQGLARRGWKDHVEAQVPAAAPDRAPEPVRAPEPLAAIGGGGDDRLRSAIENLQKMAARAG